MPRMLPFYVQAHVARLNLFVSDQKESSIMMVDNGASGAQTSYVARK